MSRIERNDTKTSNSGKKIKSFWQNGKKEPFFLAHPLVIIWTARKSILYRFLFLYFPANRKSESPLSLLSSSFVYHQVLRWRPENDWKEHNFSKFIHFNSKMPSEFYLVVNSPHWSVWQIKIRIECENLMTVLSYLGVTLLLYIIPIS